MAEIRYICQSVAYELVVRADHRDTGLYRIEPSIGKMQSSELLMRVIELCEEVYGLEGHTALHNLEKHKRDHRIITVYEGANEVQRSLVLKDLVREIWPRIKKIAGDTPSGGTGSIGRTGEMASSGLPEKLRPQCEMLEDMKVTLRRVLGDAVASFGDEIWQNPGFQSVFFRLADAAAIIKLADSALGRAVWVLRHMDQAANLRRAIWPGVIRGRYGGGSLSRRVVGSGWSLRSGAGPRGGIGRQ